MTTRIEIERGKLLKTLIVGGSLAGKSKTLPLLDCVKCSVKNGGMTITSFDGEIAVTRRCDIVSADTDVAFCINARDFNSAVKLISSDNIVIEIQDDTNSISIVHDAGDMTLAMFPASDFPSFKKEENTKELVLDSSLLLGWIRNAQRFVASDAIRPTLNCMYLYREGNEVGYCATDSQKLITERAECVTATEEENVSLLIRSSAFKAIGDVASEGEEVTMKIGKLSFTATCGQSAVFCRFVDGKFPNFKAVIPKDSTGHASANVGALMAASARASVAAGTNNILKFSVSENLISISSQDLGYGKKANEKCVCETHGGIEIGLRAAFLEDALSCVIGDSVTMKFSAPNRPLVLNEEGNDKKIMLIMPAVLAK